jgi:glucokinase
MTAARRPPFYLGIDLGGTNVKSGVVDDDGQTYSSVSLKTRAALGPEEGLKTLAEAARQAVKASGLDWKEIKAIGLGSPGTMDIEAGLLLDPPNLPGWDNLPIRQRLAELLDKPTVLQNDANAAAYGEYWAGAGRDAKSLGLFTLGTGIGCGIIDQGRIIVGRHSNGAECGHMIIQMENARQCSCGAYGHLEAYASATALVKRAVEALEEGTPSRLEDAWAKGMLSSRSIAEAAEAGDALGRRLMRETARYLAVGAVNLMNTIDPDMILFGGGMIAAGTTLLTDIRNDIKSLAFPIPAASTRIEYAALGGDAGYIGAAGCARLTHGTPEA